MSFNDGAGCFGNANRSSTLTLAFEDCKNSGNISGKNVGGLMGGGDVSYGNGGGCFGNYNNNTTLTVTFLKCTNGKNASLAGRNAGGLLGGGDSFYNGWGGGCFGNFNRGSSILTVNFQKCSNGGSLIGNNAGGILGGGNNNGGSGTGCFANSNYNTELSVRFEDIRNTGDFLGNNVNCGGICGGGNNIMYYFTENHGNDYTKGAGCFGNANTGGFVRVYFTECINSGWFLGDMKNSGGLLGGGDNSLSTAIDITEFEEYNLSCGAGCFGNFNGTTLQTTFTNCKNTGEFNGNKKNCGGFLGGGDNILEESNIYGFAHNKHIYICNGA